MPQSALALSYSPSLVTRSPACLPWSSAWVGNVGICAETEPVRSSIAQTCRMRTLIGRRTAESPRRGALPLEIRGEETGGSDRGRDAVRRLAPAMALVGELHVLDTDPTLLEGFDDLLGLDHRHVRVVGAVQHHGRRLDAVDLVDRRERLEHLRLRGGITIFRGRDRRHPGFGVFEERLEVDDAEGIGPGRE